MVVAGLIEHGDSRNRACDLAGAERGTGWRRRCTAPRDDSLHEEAPCDSAVRMVLTALAWVRWFDDGEEFAGVRVSDVVEIEPERKISGGGERPWARVIRGRLYAGSSLALEGLGHGHRHGHHLCPMPLQGEDDTA